MNRFLTTVSWLALLAACGGPPPPAPVPQRQQHILSGNEIEAIATILQLEDRRQFDEALLRGFLASRTPEVRRRAAVAAGRIGDPAAVPLLLHVLANDARPAVRADAAFALGLLPDTSATVIAALRAAAPPAWAPVREEETNVVVEVVASLGRLGSDAARAEVTDALRRVHPAPNEHSRRIAAEALLNLWRFPPGAGRSFWAIRFLDHPDPGLRWPAALALVRIGDVEATTRLESALQDPDPRVRALAARGLTAGRADSAGISDAALQGLAALVGDRDPQVRINTLRTLAGYGPRAPVDAIAASLRDRDPNVAVTAATTLASLGQDAGDALPAAADDQALPLAARAAALEGLARLHPDQALPVLERWAAGAWEQRYAAARTAPALGWPRAEPLLRRLIADSDPRVAVAATDAAGGLAAPSGAAATAPAGLRDILLTAVRATDPRQRAAALRALATVTQPGDLDLLLQAFAAATGEPGGQATAIAAVHALGALQRRGTPAAAAFFDRFPRQDDRWVARAVAETLGPGWGPAPAAGVEDLGYYRDLVQRYVAPPLAGEGRPVAIVSTAGGEIRIELLAEEAPLTVHNFVRLAEERFFDQGVWHRVVPSFVLQDGAPAGDPGGGPGWALRDEVNRVRYLRGVAGMAHSGPNTAGSQWFITYSPQPHLDGGYTVFGRVIAGQNVMDRVVQGDPVNSIRVAR
jgi:cyclophilin family peptidyl-prolyl cis-trans isomerase/HEAT repeat protein